MLLKQSNTLKVFREPCNISLLSQSFRAISPHASVPVNYTKEFQGLLDKQSTKFTIWKYWKGCVKKVETTRTFCQQRMDLASRQCTYSYSTVSEGVFTY